MAYSRLLLLLIGVISYHLTQVQARPEDFWRGRQASKRMENTIKELTDMATQAACVGSDTLPTPVVLPCVLIHKTNKTLQQKRAEVVLALQAFQDSVQGAMNQTTSECQTKLLEKLEHHILNYLGIVNRLRIQTDTVTSSPAVQNCSSQTTSVNQVVKQFGKLLKGKLDRLAIDLQDNT